MKIIAKIMTKQKKQPTEWEKIFSYNIIDKALIYKAFNMNIK